MPANASRILLEFVRNRRKTWSLDRLGEARGPQPGPNSDRQSDIDSVAGTDHAVYWWDIKNKEVDVLTAGWSDPRDTKVLVKLRGFNYIDRGSDSGIFHFRKGVPISWKIEATEEVS